MLSETFLASVKSAAYALFEMTGETPAIPETFPNINRAADRVRALRGTALLEITPSTFTWGEDARETRASVNIALRARGGDVERRFVLVTLGDHPDRLRALLSGDAARKAAA